MNRIPATLRNYFFSLLALFLLNCVLFVLDTAMGTWYVLMTITGVFGVVFTLRGFMEDTSLPAQFVEEEDEEETPPVFTARPTRPIDLTPPEFLRRSQGESYARTVNFPTDLKL